MPDCTLVYHNIHVPVCTFKSVKYAFMHWFKSLVAWPERIKHPQENFIKRYYLRITNSKQGGTLIKKKPLIAPLYNPSLHHIIILPTQDANVFSGIPDSQTNQGKKYWFKEMGSSINQEQVKIIIDKLTNNTT